MTTWAEENNKICDNQNGFRSKHSTTDHLSTLSGILECRKRKRLSTYVACVDFSKAYDRIHHGLLFNKLSSLGIEGKFLNAIMSLYDSVRCAVKLNNYLTDWFDVNIGLKQGCLLSTTLFNLYINDLSELLNNSGVDIE